MHPPSPSTPGLFSHRENNPLHHALLTVHKLARLPAVVVLAALFPAALAQGLWWCGLDGGVLAAAPILLGVAPSRKPPAANISACFTGP